MKRIFTFLLLIAAISSMAQTGMRITEINYNGPEAGADSTEFIELYNPTSSPINLNGYSFSQGVVYTFPNVTVPAGGYFVVGVDSVAMLNVFGVNTYQWTSGGLSNGGEDITLVDALGNTVDSVDYDDGSPWPTSPDGNGPTLVLCDLQADQNLGSSWDTSSTATGLIVNGKAVFASPGALDASCSSNPPVLTDPVYDISVINNTDANGVADSIGVYCWTKGLVLGVDMRGGSGIQFTLYDGEGIGVFNFADVNNYVVTEGDSIMIRGTVGQFNGLTQLGSIDTISVLNTGNSIPSATVVTTLTESMESTLVKFENAYVNAVSGSNYTLVSGTDTITMRIDSDTDVLDSLTIASGDSLCAVTGIVGQFDSSNPYTSGYQLFPRTYVDVDTTCGSTSPPTTPELGFNSISTDVNEMDTTFMIEVALTNANSMPVSFVVNYDTANSSAINGVDVDFTPVLVTVPANTDSVVALPFTVNQDADDEGMTPEEAIIYIVGAMNADLTDSVHTVTIMDDDFVIPTYAIETVRTVDSNYVLDSLNVYCKLEGIVYGKDLFGGGYSFAIYDGTAGINVLSFSNIGSFEVHQGDEVRVIGEIGQYNGLAQIEIDSVVVLSTGNCIDYPNVVFELDETTESAPIYMLQVHLADASQWPNPGANANLDVVTMDGDTITMRIDKDTKIADTLTTPPTGMFNLSGVGGQFDNSSPYNSGYQIFPMFVSDFDTMPGATPDLYINEVMVDNQTVIADPEGDFDSWIEIYNAGGADVDLTGMFIYSDGADMPHRFSRCASAVTVPANGWALLWADEDTDDGEAHLPFMLNAADTLMLLNKDAVVIDSIAWTSSTADVSYGYEQDGNGVLVNFSTSTPNASNNGGIVLSVVNTVAKTDLMVYPNPVTNGNINFNKEVSIQVYSVSGQLVATRTNVKSLNVSTFDKGIYVIETTEGEVVKMIVK